MSLHHRRLISRLSMAQDRACMLSYSIVDFSPPLLDVGSWGSTSIWVPVLPHKCFPCFPCVTPPCTAGFSYSRQFYAPLGGFLVYSSQILQPFILSVPLGQALLLALTLPSALWRCQPVQQHLRATPRSSLPPSMPLRARRVAIPMICFSATPAS